MRYDNAFASAMVHFGVESCAQVSRFKQKSQQEHWFMACPQLERERVPQGRKSALGLPQHFRMTSHRYPSGRLGAAH